MEREPLFILEAPVCAMELGHGRTTTMCPLCGRGHTVQTSELDVELMCEPRALWLSSRNAILVEAQVANEIERNRLWQVGLMQVQRRWQDGLPWGDTRIPNLRQLVAEQSIAAAPESVEFEECECGSVRSIEFRPLIVRPPDAMNAGIWFLKENPSVLVIGERLRTLLARHDVSAEFGYVYYEGEYLSSTTTLDGVSWDDLN